MPNFIILIFSAVASWMATPFYLSIMPSVDSVVAKVIGFFVFFLVLSLLFGKK